MLNKKLRKIITLECLACKNNFQKRHISRYTTFKNKQNTPKKLELKKFCAFCKKHMNYRELK
uniref:Large ribosomal subunit protein bL33c n=1 Tax=Pteridomonas sp. YPF1301 TaxID=2766739 RepID=A0A7G1MNG4_9STRA|nr:ribosomal protein L33 [Pteridomonas sp. YPF1301]